VTGFIPTRCYETDKIAVKVSNFRNPLPIVETEKIAWQIGARRAAI